MHSDIIDFCLENYQPAMIADHFLGEFSSRVYLGTLSFEDGLKLVYARTMDMQKVCDNATSTMAAIIALDNEIIELDLYKYFD